MPVIVVLLLFLFACSSLKTIPSRPDGLDSEKAPAVSEKAAQNFDDYVHGKLSPEALAKVKEECQKAPDANLFCHSYLHPEGLDRKIRQTLRINHPADFHKQVT